MKKFPPKSFFGLLRPGYSVPSGRKFGALLQLAPRVGCACVRRITPHLVLGVALFASSAWSQNAISNLPAFGGKFSVCDSGENTVPVGQLTFRQQACWYANDLAAPTLLVRAGFSTALGQWHNDIYGKGQDGPDYAHRFGVFYARHAARDTAELVAGYLNHEDPRPHVSGETGLLRRTKAALASVVVTKTDEGDRLALTPIAGAFGSALVGSALSREHSFTGHTFAREAIFSYSNSFATAVFREFKPDISTLVRHALHKAAQ